MAFYTNLNDLREYLDEISNMYETGDNTPIICHLLHPNCMQEEHSDPNDPGLTIVTQVEGTSTTVSEDGKMTERDNARCVMDAVNEDVSDYIRAKIQEKSEYFFENGLHEDLSLIHI